jgi:hypothetical protein
MYSLTIRALFVEVVALVTAGMAFDNWRAIIAVLGVAVAL